MNQDIEPAVDQQRKMPHLLIPFVKSASFRALWIGNSLSTLGSAITMIILPIVVYRLTHSTMSMGLVMTCYMLPNVIILPFAGIIVDKFNRLFLMMGADFIRALLVFSLMTLGLSQLLDLRLLLIIAVLFGLMDGIFQPAFAAIRAVVFTPDIRTAANGLTQLSVQMMRLAGPALGGVIVAFLSAPLGFGIDGITYFISFFCLFFIRERHSPPAVQSGKKRSFFQECFEGLRILKTQTWLWVTILAFSFINICTSGMIAILIPWLVNVHNQSEPYVYGLIMSGEGIGAALAALVFGMRRKWKHRGLIAYLGVALCGLALFFMPLFSLAPVLIGLMILEGIGMMAFGLIWETSLQELVAAESFGRVASIDMLGSFALLPAGYLFTGWFAEQVGGAAAMLIMSSAVIVLTAIALTVPAIRCFD